MPGRNGQPRVRIAQLHHQGKPCWSHVTQPHDPKPPDLQEPNERRRGPRQAILDLHAIVGNQVEAARKEAEDQIGLADTRWTYQQHAFAVAAGAAPMDLHARPIWTYTRWKGSDL